MTEITESVTPKETRRPAVSIFNKGNAGNLLRVRTPPRYTPLLIETKKTERCVLTLLALTDQVLKHIEPMMEMLGNIDLREVLSALCYYGEGEDKHFILPLNPSESLKNLTTYDFSITNITYNIDSNYLSRIDIPKEDIEAVFKFIMDSEDRETLRAKLEKVTTNYATDNAEKLLSALSIALEILPPEPRRQFLGKIKDKVTVLEKLEQTPPPLPDKVPADDLFVGGRGSNAIEHLEKVYSQWLKHFSPDLDKDYMFVSDLERLDPTLLQAVRTQVANSRKRGIKLWSNDKEIVKTNQLIRPKLSDSLAAQLAREYRNG